MPEIRNSGSYQKLIAWQFSHPFVITEQSFDFGHCFVCFTASFDFCIPLWYLYVFLILISHKKEHWNMRTDTISMVCWISSVIVFNELYFFYVCLDSFFYKMKDVFILITLFCFSYFCCFCCCFCVFLFLFFWFVCLLCFSSLISSIIYCSTVIVKEEKQCMRNRH